ncbi:MAG: DUF1501 domain-containing protein [Bryobacteraceae bacterium]
MMQIGFRRREFLHAGSLSMLGLGLAPAGAEPRSDLNCILLMLVGGPSHLDTWDMKPDAPADIRGPFRAIRTNVPGIEISEIFPRMARIADKYAIVRGMHHSGAAMHDTGYQLVQTGRIFRGGIEHPHIGCALARLKGSNGDLPSHVLLPRPIGNTGGNLPHGQDAGYLGAAYNPFVPMGCEHGTDIAASRGLREAFDIQREPERLREDYGATRFGQNCLLARRLVESGVRFVTVNMFETVFEEITWDAHGTKPFSSMSAYRDHVGPMFDRAYSALLRDLDRRGLLASTMVIATGEFGRTPRINHAGGRDHWTHCWSMLMAGGGVRGGQVIGSSDATGAYPKDRPTTPAEIAATVYHAAGIPLDTELRGPGSKPVRLVDAGVEPVRELFG